MFHVNSYLSLSTRTPENMYFCLPSVNDNKKFTCNTKRSFWLYLVFLPRNSSENTSLTISSKSLYTAQFSLRSVINYVISSSERDQHRFAQQLRIVVVLARPSWFSIQPAVCVALAWQLASRSCLSELLVGLELSTRILLFGLGSEFLVVQ
jgi:hypothetical protein